MRNVFTISALSALSLSLLASCSSSSEENTTVDNSVPVRVDTIVTTEVDRKIEYTANLEAYQQVYVAPTLSGTRIRKIYVEVGDHFKKGQPLVEMDDNSFTQQELQLKNLETEYNRAVKLKETGSISQQNYDQAVTSYEVAKKALAQLRENTRMVAPFDGVVTGKYMEEGELYSGGAYGGASKPSILAIEQVSTMKALVNISEKYYLEIKKGMSVQLHSDVYTDRVFDGKVTIVYPTIDASSRTFSVELQFPNPKEELKSGMYGTISFATGRAKAQVVQSNAVLKVQGSNDRYLFLAKDGKAERVTVKITDRYDDKVEIQAIDKEIKEGDLIVTTGQGKLVDGREIRIVE